MLKIYGSMLCPDCVQCCNDLDSAGICYEFLDFAKNLKYLKEFLAIREQEPIFESVRVNGAIGIPCIVDMKGNVTLDWEIYVTQADA